MTDPLLPAEPEPAERRVIRELAGLLLVLAGLAAGLWVLATVDWRLPAGVGALLAVAAGLYLGRDRAETEGD